jgi:hypothetical protein
MNKRQPHQTRDEIRASIVAGLSEFIDALADELWEVQNVLEVQDAELAALKMASPPEKEQP